MTEQTTKKTLDLHMKLELTDPSTEVRSDIKTSDSTTCSHENIRVRKVSKLDLKKIKQEKLQLKAETEFKMKREELLRVDPDDMDDADEGSTMTDAELSDIDDVTAVTTSEYMSIGLQALKVSMKVRSEGQHIQKLIDCVRAYLDSSCTLLGKKLQEKAQRKPQPSMQPDECRTSLIKEMQTAAGQKKGDPRQLHFWFDSISRTWTTANSTKDIDGQSVLETCYTFLVMSNANREFLASIIAAMEPELLGAGIKRPAKIELTDGNDAISDQLCQPAKACVIRFLMGARPDLLFSLLDRFHALANQLHVDLEHDQAEKLQDFLASEKVARKTDTFYQIRDEAQHLFEAIRMAIGLPRTPIPKVAAWPVALDTLDPRAMFCYRHPDLVSQLKIVGDFDDMNSIRPMLLVITHFQAHGASDKAKTIIQFLYRRFHEMVDKYNVMQRESDSVATQLAEMLVDIGHEDDEDEDKKEESRKAFEKVEWELRRIEDDLLDEWRENLAEEKRLVEGLRTIFKFIQSDEELNQQYESLPRTTTVFPTIRRVAIMDKIVEAQKATLLDRTDLSTATRKHIQGIKAHIYALENGNYVRSRLITERLLPVNLIERRLMENRVEQGVQSALLSDWMRYWEAQKGVDLDRVRELFTVRERPQPTSSKPSAATDHGDKLAVVFSLKQLQSLNTQKKNGRNSRKDQRECELAATSTPKESKWSSYKVGVGSALDSKEMQVSRQETEALVEHWSHWRDGFGISAYPPLTELIPIQRAAVEYDALLRERDKLETEEALLNDARVTCLAAENNTSFDVDSFTAIEHADIPCRSKELAKREAALERVLLKEELDEARALAIEKEKETKAWVNNHFSMKPDEVVFLKLARKYSMLDDEKPRPKHSHRAHKKTKAHESKSDDTTSCASDVKSPSKANAKPEQGVLDETIAHGFIQFGVEDSLQARATATLSVNVTRSTCSPQKRSLSTSSDDEKQTTDEVVTRSRRKRLRRLVVDDEDMPALEDVAQACTPCATQPSPLKLIREIIPVD